MLFKKGSKLYSIANNKCPKCHEGDYFVEANPFNLKKLTAVHEKCSKCNQPYSLEPGFYFGAAYVSYGFGVALFVASFLATYILWPSATFVDYTWITCGTVFLLFTVNYKLSRITYLNIFVQYDKAAITIN